MAFDGFRIVIVLVAYLLVIGVVGLALYIIVRFGVKHGMRSYHADGSHVPRKKEESAEK